MDVLKGHLPALVLAEVAREPGHGYALVQRLNAVSGELFGMPEGTVYPVLHKLESDGCVKAEWQESNEGRRIKIYTITAKGRRRLAGDRSRWSAMSARISVMLRFARRDVPA
jgi:DNA-binding PadR family transcriptional regulator